MNAERGNNQLDLHTLGEFPRHHEVTLIGSKYQAISKYAGYARCVLALRFLQLLGVFS
jgi:hypothetical protein